ncbi:MAG: RMD1 family protein [Burkholderiales bacterium]|nr:RMD1 family protein [Burkholderiales bacterium]
MPLRPDFKARAILVADRIDLRGWKAEERMASNPLVVAVPGGGAAVLFRYGAAVFFDVMPEEESGFLARLARLAAGPLGAGETEEVEVSVDPRAREGMQGGRVLLAGDDVERLQIVADVLSKSVVLAYYESQVAGSFERVEPLAQQLEREGRIAASPGEISRHIGAMLLTGHTMVGRAAVAEKPELLWEHPELEGLFIRLEDEFEIRERQATLAQKLELVAHTAQTLVQLQEGRHMVRLELYIVLLIVFEILLTLYGMFLGR